MKMTETLSATGEKGDPDLLPEGMRQEDWGGFVTVGLLPLGDQNIPGLRPCPVFSTAKCAPMLPLIPYALGQAQHGPVRWKAKVLPWLG